MPQIRKILELLPMKKQNLFFSATFPEKVEQYAYEFTDFPEKIEVTPQATTAVLIDQYQYQVPNFLTKINLLEYLLKNEQLERVIIFTKTKKYADNVFHFISRKITDSVRVIHANKAQSTRINAIEAFKSGEIRILVSTDVTSRGIDINEVSHVINFDTPDKAAEYVHRVGRTGRIQNKGTAITFVNAAEKYAIETIESLTNQKIPLVKLPKNIEAGPFLTDEERAINQQIDRAKRLLNPDFKGAFHEKKKSNQKISGKKPDYKRKSNSQRKKRKR